MNRKTDKIEDPTAPYGAKKVPEQATASQAGVKYVDDATFKKAMEKVFKTHKELLRKLAQ